MTEVITSAFVVMGAVLAIVTMHSAYLLASTKQTVVTWIYPVVVIVTIALAVTAVVEIQGYPINGKPKGEWEYTTHVEQGSSVLVIVKENTEDRTYRFEPTEEEKEALQKVKEGKEKGLRHNLRFEGETPQMTLIRVDQENPKDD